MIEYMSHCHHCTFNTYSTSTVYLTDIDKIWNISKTWEKVLTNGNKCVDRCRRRLTQDTHKYIFNFDSIRKIKNVWNVSSRYLTATIRHQRIIQMKLMCNMYFYPLFLMTQSNKMTNVDGVDMDGDNRNNEKNKNRRGF